MNSTLDSIIDNHKNIALLTGAGISTGSGIKDFRSNTGLYTSDYNGHDAKDILSRRFFDKHRDIFWDYTNTHLNYDTFKPNKMHHFAKTLDDMGKLTSVITQNIDGLYHKTGLAHNKIIEIHGHNRYLTCFKCGKNANTTDCIISKKGNYLCPHDNFLMNTNIILYGDTFKSPELDRYWNTIGKSDALLVMGTSLEICAHMDTVIRFNGDIYLINNEDIKLESYAGMREWTDTIIGDFKSLST